MLGQSSTLSVFAFFLCANNIILDSFIVCIFRHLCSLYSTHREILYKLLKNKLISFLSLRTCTKSLTFSHFVNVSLKKTKEKQKP